MSLISIDNYTVPHDKGKGGGNVTYVINNGGNSKSSMNYNSVNASMADIDYLTAKSITANDAEIMYLQTKEGQILKLTGDSLKYNRGQIDDFTSNSIETNKLKAQDIDALKAWIETLNSKEITTEYLTVTKQAHFFELVIDKIRSVGGQIILSSANCVIDKVYGYSGSTLLGIDEFTAAQNSQIDKFYVYWKAKDNSTGRSITNDWEGGDQAICQSFNNVSEGVNYNVANKYYWRKVNGLLADKYINLSTGEQRDRGENLPTSLQFKIGLKATQTQLKSDTPLINNEIRWKVQSQGQEVYWSNTIINGYTAAAVIMTTASQSLGIQIVPDVEDVSKLATTVKLELYIAKYGSMTSDKAENINVGVYFNDGTYKFFPNIESSSGTNEYVIDLDNPPTPIECITIVSTNKIDWYLCHGMILSNTNKDSSPLTSDAAILASYPGPGDNLVQLGYHGGDPDLAYRQSAIIISANKTIDQGGTYNGYNIPAIVSPSYAQYQGIGSISNHRYDLYVYRQSYFDANGATFKGDISLCTIGGQSIDQAIESNSKRLLIDTGVVQVNVSGGTTVQSISPAAININIISIEGENSEVLNAVPSGYKVIIYFFNSNNQEVQASKITKNGGDSLLSISLPTGTNLGDINRFRTDLEKIGTSENIIIDSKEINYIRSAASAVTGRYEFRYKNYTPTSQSPTPTKPTTGSDGTSGGWARSVSSPNTANGEFTFMTQCYANQDNTYGEWTNPIRITGGNGKDGEDGTEIEFIYTQNDSGVAPDAPPTTQTDDWHGTTGGVTWYDNPQGVSANMRFEYVSMRYKENDVWGAYSTPVIWSTWGVKGMDGDGYEYVYKTTTTNSAPTITTPSNWATDSTYQSDDYVPTGEGWYDEPQTLNSTYKWQWVSTRKKTYNALQDSVIWHPFTTPKLWSNFVTADGGVPGQDGKDAILDILMPVKEMFYADLKTSTGASQKTRVRIDLDYKLVQKEGDTVNELVWATSGYTLKVYFYNNKMQSLGSSSGYTITNGEYSQNNLMSTLGLGNNIDWKVWSTTPPSQTHPTDNWDYCPSFAKVVLSKSDDVVETRLLYLQVEEGAAMKIMDDRIVTVIGDTQGSSVVGYLQNNYYTKTETASAVTSTVTQTTYTKNEVESKLSEVEQTAEQYSVNVYEDIDGKLSQSGIDIDAHTIELNSENTNIHGTLNVYKSSTGSPKGLRVWDDTASNSSTCTQITNENLGTIQNYLTSNLAESNTISTNIIANDGLILTGPPSGGAANFNQFVWWGKSLSNKYEFIARNKNYNLRVSEDGLLRSLMKSNLIYDQGISQWVISPDPIFSDAGKNAVDGTSVNENKWADISSTVPILEIDETKNDADFTSSSSDIQPDNTFRTHGIFIAKYSGVTTIYIPHGDTCPGRIVTFRSVGGTLLLKLKRNTLPSAKFYISGNNTPVNEFDAGSRTVQLIGCTKGWIVMKSA